MGLLITLSTGKEIKSQLFWLLLTSAVLFRCQVSDVAAQSVMRTHRSTWSEAEGGPAGSHAQAFLPSSCCAWRHGEGERAAP